MAINRGRMIRQSITTDGKVAKLSLVAKLLYTWSIPFCDRDGRMRADSLWIKANIAIKLPELNEEDIENAVQEWATANLVVLYQDEDGKYAQFNNFMTLQKMVKEDGKHTVLYSHTAISQIPHPTSCKITGGKMYCHGLDKVKTKSDQSIDFVYNEDKIRQDKISKDKTDPVGSDFINEIENHGYKPESFEEMNGRDVLSYCLGWILKEKDILLPAGSTEWDNITSRDHGIAKGIGKVTTPLWLPRQLAYVKQCGGFKDGPFSPLVLSLIIKYNETDRRALEDRADEI